jgi:heptosyltransferase-1
MVLDAQSLVKSALLTFLVNAKRVGLGKYSARERLASFAYQRRCTVDFYQHAIVRMRNLFSQALGYALPMTVPDYGISHQPFAKGKGSREPYLVFLHGTMWATKQWPEIYWVQLAQLAVQAGYRVKISGGNEEEIARAGRISQSLRAVDVLPQLDIASVAQLLVHASAAVTVDTGFGHLAAALAVPTVSLYGPTDPRYTGVLGSIQLAAHFPCAPCLNRVCTYRQSSVVSPACFSALPPARVWAAVQDLLTA